MRDSLYDIDDKFICNMLQDVSANFLHMVKDKVQANAEVKMPISYFTTAIEDSIRFQRVQDAIIAEESGTKPKASGDVLVGQEKHFKEDDAGDDGVKVGYTFFRELILTLSHKNVENEP